MEDQIQYIPVHRCIFPADKVVDGSCPDVPGAGLKNANSNDSDHRDADECDTSHPLVKNLINADLQNQFQQKYLFEASLFSVLKTMWAADVWLKVIIFLKKF